MEQESWIGRSLGGRYEIEEMLGRGGMSAVYKATDPKLKRTVAVKLIHPHLSRDDDFIRRFKTEAASIAAFRHPNIVQVYDFDYDGENYFMVMEYIPGGTLQDQLRKLKKLETVMHPEQAIRIVIGVCDALAYAHKLGAIHRDIKPANIMLTDEEQPILMDFGLVKILNATSHTASGAIIGTARYMPPEIINDEPPDERSDIYSLGITLYEALTSAPPFDAESVLTLITMHLNDPVPDLSALRPDIPHGLMRIVNKSLEKDRNDRYSSADEIGRDLKRILPTLQTAPVSRAKFGRLTVKLPDGGEMEFGVSKPEITVGRGESNDVVIDDERVSRSHARLEINPQGEVKVIDTGSTNGVMVNGVKVKETAIRPGDVIEMGGSQIRYVNLSDNDQITIVG
ncbi:MAG TPA: FHA domain-containing serine/threonine-protein kinase [Anaerolineales bacterium]|nr:FHA domain-containing serine/threonine-protein kinase [Anaerolineales bacterium]